MACWAYAIICESLVRQEATSSYLWSRICLALTERPAYRGPTTQTRAHDPCYARPSSYRDGWPWCTTVQLHVISRTAADYDSKYANNISPPRSWVPYVRTSSGSYNSPSKTDNGEAHVLYISQFGTHTVHGRVAVCSITGLSPELRKMK